MNDLAKNAFFTETVDGVEYTDLVPQNYQYDPETEDLIYGDQLREGMVVLADVHGRADENDPWKTRELLVKNRWCEVTNKRSDDCVYFLGLYDNSVKALRTSARSQSWIIKKDSIPPAPASTMLLLPTENQFSYRPSKGVVALWLALAIISALGIWSLVN